MSEPKVSIPGYRIIRQIGKGGMSNVYLAEQEVFQREIALKVLSGDVTNQFGDRFLREAKLVAQLTHANIIHVYDTGVSDGQYFLAMEFLSGGDLASPTLGSANFIDPFHVSISVLEALDFAADKHVVHRDVKPANIMFRADGTVVLLDFGLARNLTTESRVTQIGTMMGTPHYMSPEQVEAKEADNRSDIYSFGIVLYEMLTGDVPFTADTTIAIGMKHLTAPIPVLPSRLAEFQPIIEKALAKDPRQRYQRAVDFANDLLSIEHKLPADAFQGLTVPLNSSDKSVGFAPGLMSRTGSNQRRLSKITGTRAGERNRHKAWFIAAGLFVAALALLWVTFGPRLKNVKQQDLSASTNAGQVDEITTASAGADNELAKKSVAASELEEVGLNSSGSPINNEALEYLDRALQALEAGNHQKAVELANIGLASNGNPETLLQLDGIVIRAEKIQEQEAETARLRLKLTSQINAGNFVSLSPDNAYLTLRSLNEVDTDTAYVDSQRKQIERALRASIQSEIGSGNIEAAQTLITKATNIVPSAVLAPLMQAVNDIRNNKIAQQTQTRAALEYAAALELNPTSSVEEIGAAISRWESVLDVDPNNLKAQAKLDGIAKLLSIGANTALSTRELDQAAAAITQLSRLQGTTSTDTDYERLRLEVQSAGFAREKAERLMNAARRKTSEATQAIGDMSVWRDRYGGEALKNSIGALYLIDESLLIDPSVPGAQDLFIETNKLLNTIITAGSDARKFNLVRDTLDIYLNRELKVLAIKPTQTEIMKKIDADEAKSKRGFSTF